MIYVSSSCVRNSKIKDSVMELVENGFRNIELSGGTEYYDGFENDLLELKDKYNLNYICHNYFPPPKEHLVLNLASLNDDIYNKTFEQLKNAILLSKKLGAKKFGFHAGFFIDIKVSEIGKKITKDSLFDKTKAIKRFCNGLIKLQSIDKILKLYIENNVLSSTNYDTYKGENLFMLTNYDEYKQLKQNIDFNLLLDVAHLKVSATSLSIDFQNQLSNMLKVSDYIHLSDNDGLHDLNNTLEKDSQLVELLKKHDLKNKDLTIEVYDDLSEIKNSYELLEGLINA